MKFERLKEILKPEAYKSLMIFMVEQTVDGDGVFEGDFMTWFDKKECVD